MNCKYLKKKINQTLFCKKQNKQIYIADCSCCSFKEYNSNHNTLKKATPRLIEKQTKRFSIIYHSLDFCCSCDLKHVKKQHIDLNEVYEGAKRQASMTYGFIIPLCRQCHTRFHNDREFALKYKKMFQQEFEKTHTREEFIKIIHKNYL